MTTPTIRPTERGRLAVALDECIDALGAGGLVVTDDPSKLHPPGALVVLDSLDFDRLDSSRFSVTLTVVLVVRDAPPPAEKEALSRLLEQLFAVTEAAASFELVGVSLPNHAADPLTGLQTTLTFDCQSED